MVNMKLEQSAMRTDTAGSFPGRVPVTALAQLSALQALRARILERTPWARPKAMIQDRTFIARCR